MGLLSALSGKIYHLNSIITPVNNEIVDKIKNLEKSKEEGAFCLSFQATQKIIKNLFHPDEGILKDSIKQLDQDRLKKIYEILIMFIVIDMLYGNNKVSDLKKERINNNAMIVLGLNIEQQNFLFNLFKDKSVENKMSLLWQSICRNANKNLIDDNHLMMFMEIYADSFDLSDI